MPQSVGLRHFLCAKEAKNSISDYDISRFSANVLLTFVKSLANKRICNNKSALMPTTSVTF
ncbi:hypothetical protein GCM10007278_10710 [Paenalcaligenes hominis]|nr:hypothetical protein GCM10007278_10710 [Paenalcaligenes hominis]